MTFFELLRKFCSSLPLQLSAYATVTATATVSCFPLPASRFPFSISRFLLLLLLLLLLPHSLLSAAENLEEELAEAKRTARQTLDRNKELLSQNEAYEAKVLKLLDQIQAQESEMQTLSQKLSSAFEMVQKAKQGAPLAASGTAPVSEGKTAGFSSEDLKNKIESLSQENKLLSEEQKRLEAELEKFKQTKTVAVGKAGLTGISAAEGSSIKLHIENQRLEKAKDTLIEKLLQARSTLMLLKVNLEKAEISRIEAESEIEQLQGKIKEFQSKAEVAESHTDELASLSEAPADKTVPAQPDASVTVDENEKPEVSDDSTSEAGEAKVKSTDELEMLLKKVADLKRSPDLATTDSPPAKKSEIKKKKRFFKKGSESKKTSEDPAAISEVDREIQKKNLLIDEKNFQIQKKESQLHETHLLIAAKEKEIEALKKQNEVLRSNVSSGSWEKPQPDLERIVTQEKENDSLLQTNLILAAKDRQIETLKKENEELDRTKGKVKKVSSDQERQNEKATRKISNLVEKERQIETLKRQNEELARRNVIDRATFLYNLGIIYTQQGLFKEASEAYEAALELQPHDASTHYNLGILYEEHFNNYPKAILHYEAFMRYSKDQKMLREVDEWIKINTGYKSGERRSRGQSARHAFEQLFLTTGS